MFLRTHDNTLTSQQYYPWVNVKHVDCRDDRCGNKTKIKGVQSAFRSNESVLYSYLQRQPVAAGLYLRDSIYFRQYKGGIFDRDIFCPPPVEMNFDHWVAVVGKRWLSFSCLFVCLCVASLLLVSICASRRQVLARKTARITSSLYALAFALSSSHTAETRGAARGVHSVTWPSQRANACAASAASTRCQCD